MTGLIQFLRTYKISPIDTTGILYTDNAHGNSCYSIVWVHTFKQALIDESVHYNYTLQIQITLTFNASPLERIQAEHFFLYRLRWDDLYLGLDILIAKLLAEIWGNSTRFVSQLGQSHSFCVHLCRKCYNTRHFSLKKKLPLTSTVPH